MPTGAHLVGSVPLASAGEVFDTASRILGRHLRRISDGETGPRSGWIAFQFPILATVPEFEPAAPDPNGYGPPKALRVRDDADWDSIEIPPLGYADAALASYEVFKTKKLAGAIRPHLRFQVSLPTPLASVNVFFAHESRAAVEGPFSVALARELERILAVIPHEELTIQWDVCQEVGLWEGFQPPHWSGDVKEHVVGEIAGMAELVPETVELGFHLCYGDYDHEHFMQPKDLGAVVEIANALSRHIARPIGYVHLPEPQERSDDAYFVPLEGLDLTAATELYLGLLHVSDGVAGARERIAAAQRHAADFGVATECGLGRRPAEQIPGLLALHGELAAPIEVSA
jgi:hypothetical protein